MTKANSPSSRTGITLANWRHAPHNRFAFHRVSEFIGTAPIRKSRHTTPLLRNLVRPEDFPGEITNSSLEAWLARSETDAFVVLKEGTIEGEEARELLESIDAVNKKIYDELNKDEKFRQLQERLKELKH